MNKRPTMKDFPNIEKLIDLLKADADQWKIENWLVQDIKDSKIINLKENFQIKLKNLDINVNTSGFIENLYNFVIEEFKTDYLIDKKHLHKGFYEMSDPEIKQFISNFQNKYGQVVDKETVLELLDYTKLYSIFLTVKLQMHYFREYFEQKIKNAIEEFLYETNALIPRIYLSPDELINKNEQFHSIELILKENKPSDKVFKVINDLMLNNFKERFEFEYENKKKPKKEKLKEFSEISFCLDRFKNFLPHFENIKKALDRNKCIDKNKISEAEFRLYKKVEDIIYGKSASEVTCEFILKEYSNEYGIHYSAGTLFKKIQELEKKPSRLI